MSSHVRVSSILLAAGLSSRMNSACKLLLQINDKAVVRHAAENSVRSRVMETIVVVGAERRAVEASLSGLSAKPVYNAAFARGMSTSLQTGLKNISPSSEGALILMGDQPNLRPEKINLFVARFQSTTKGIVAGQYGPVIGNPVLFSSRYFEEIATLQGDTGAKSLLAKYVHDMSLVDLASEDVLDVDTLDDYERAAALMQAGAAD